MDPATGGLVGLGPWDGVFPDGSGPPSAGRGPRRTYFLWHSLRGFPQIHTQGLQKGVFPRHPPSHVILGSDGAPRSTAFPQWSHFCLFLFYFMFLPSQRTFVFFAFTFLFIFFLNCWMYHIRTWKKHIKTSNFFFCGLKQIKDNLLLCMVMHIQVFSQRLIIFPDSQKILISGFLSY